MAFVVGDRAKVIHNAFMQRTAANPTLVLLPGMDGTGLLFEPLVAALGGKVATKIVRYPHEGDLGYPELLLLAQAALPEGPCVLLGESFSGPIAIALAATNPQVRGLILCCSFARNPVPFAGWLGPVVGALPAVRPPLVLLEQALLGSWATPRLKASLAQAVRQVQPAALRARLRAVLAVDESAKLASIRAPALYLQAAHDRVVPTNACELVAKHIPALQVTKFDAPHFLLQTAPAQSASRILEFLGATAEFVD